MPGQAIKQEQPIVTATITKILDQPRPIAEIREPPKPYKFGRPTKYTPQLCQDLIDFFSTPPYTEKEIPHYDTKTGQVAWTDTKRVPNDIPTLTAFCTKYQLGWGTVHNWIEPDDPTFCPDFLNAYTHARALRADFLVNGGWNNVCQANTFKFIAVNLTDMRDKQEVEHNVKDSIASLIQAASQEQHRKRVESVTKPALEAVKAKTATDCSFR